MFSKPLTASFSFSFTQKLEKNELVWYPCCLDLATNTGRDGVMAEGVPLGVLICTYLSHLFDDSHPLNSCLSFHIEIQEDMEYILGGLG